MQSSCQLSFVDNYCPVCFHATIPGSYFLLPLHTPPPLSLSLSRASVPWVADSLTEGLLARAAGGCPTFRQIYTCMTAHAKCETNKYFSFYPPFSFSYPPPPPITGMYASIRRGRIVEKADFMVTGNGKGKGVGGEAELSLLTNIT